MNLKLIYFIFVRVRNVTNFPAVLPTYFRMCAQGQLLEKNAESHVMSRIKQGESHEDNHLSCCTMSVVPRYFI